MRHDHIRFQFYGPDEDSQLIGEVLNRGVGERAEMVISINDLNGASPYLLIGAKKSGSEYFTATNTASERTATVHASWAAVEGAYVGRWTEDGVEYVFRFRLPSGDAD